MTGVSIVGNVIVGVDGYGDATDSAMGSNASENVETEDVGLYGEGGTEVVGDKMSRENRPSRTDCFRACG